MVHHLAETVDVVVVTTRQLDACQRIAHRRQADTALLVGLDGIEVDVAQSCPIVDVLAVVGARKAAGR